MNDKEKEKQAEVEELAKAMRKHCDKTTCGSSKNSCFQCLAKFFISSGYVKERTEGR